MGSKPSCIWSAHRYRLIPIFIDRLRRARAPQSAELIAQAVCRCLLVNQLSDPGHLEAFLAPVASWLITRCGAKAELQALTTLVSGQGWQGTPLCGPCQILRPRG